MRYTKHICELEVLSTSLLGAEIRITWYDGQVTNELLKRKDTLNFTHDITFEANNESISKTAVETFLDLVGFNPKN